MNRTARTTRTAVTASTLAVIALGLTACGDDGADDSAAPAATTVTVTESPTQEADTGQNKNKNNDTRTQDTGNDTGDAMAAAARTALGAASGTVVGLDRQYDGVWEVDVVAQDGSETQVIVSADGRQVTDQRPDVDDADDLAENQQLLTATVDWAAAIQAGSPELSGPVDDIDLGEEDGRIVWDVSTDGEGPGTSVVVDAQSGDVIGYDD